eukprot:TRINITY_DN14292_c0_g1_i1.p1 TRINITY_DN14292_c0_g1~~TRINITY_DN14292_c0_g1_i1.p1  ORF type:complete len:164 (+),score=23.80 TRINITY_DN14292_c0_g1_i1:280-771(+)
MNDCIPNTINKMPPDIATIFSDIRVARLLPPSTAAVVQRACANMPPKTTPIGFSSAANPIVASWLLSPHSPKNVREKASKRIGEKNCLANGLLFFLALSLSIFCVCVVAFLVSSFSFQSADSLASTSANSSDSPSSVIPSHNDQNPNAKNRMVVIRCVHLRDS